MKWERLVVSVGIVEEVGFVELGEIVRKSEVILHVKCLDGDISMERKLGLMNSRPTKGDPNAQWLLILAEQLSNLNFDFSLYKAIFVLGGSATNDHPHQINLTTVADIPNFISNPSALQTRLKLEKYLRKSTIQLHDKTSKKTIYTWAEQLQQNNLHQQLTYFYHFISYFRTSRNKKLKQYFNKWRIVHLHQQLQHQEEQIIKEGYLQEKFNSNLKIKCFAGWLNLYRK